MFGTKSLFFVEQLRMEKNTAPSDFHIDPETGELLKHTPKKSIADFFRHISQHRFYRFFHRPPGAFVIPILLICATFFYLFRQNQFLRSHLEKVLFDVAAYQKQLDETKFQLEMFQSKIDELKAEEDELIFENFWGNDQAAIHLQSMKYIGHYVLNGRLYAHTKSVLGNRYLVSGEKVNDDWQVKSISTDQIILHAKGGKTYVVQKETP